MDRGAWQATVHGVTKSWSPRGNPACRGTFGGRRKAVRDRLALQVKGFGIVNKAEIDVFLKLSCFFHDPVDIGNLISGSSAFSKTSLNIRKFTVHILLKPGLENFEQYFTRGKKKLQTM